MYWPGGASTWYEGHNSFGVTSTGLRWGLAEGEHGGPTEAQTFVLIANTSTFDGLARLTVYGEDGTLSVVGASPYNFQMANLTLLGAQKPERTLSPLPILWCCTSRYGFRSPP